MTMPRIALFSLGIALSVACAPAPGAPDAGGSDGDGGGGDVPDAGPVPTVPVTGVVYDNSQEGDQPLVGATVELYGASPAVTTTTGADGTFTLEVPEGERTVFLRVATAGWGELRPVRVGATGATDVRLRPPTDAQVSEVATALGLVIDPAKGVLNARFTTPSLVGGETITLGAASGPSFSFRRGEPIVMTAVEPRSEGAGDPDLIFTSVTTGTTTLTAHGAAGATSCALEHADVTAWPVAARTMTTVAVTCTATGAGRAVVSGFVRVDEDVAPNALVSIVGSSPLISTHTDSEGFFALSAPRGVVAIRSAAPDAWALVNYIDVGEEGADVEFGGPSDAQVEEATSPLGLTYTETKGVVTVQFDGNAPAGGEAATITATHDVAFTFRDGSPAPATALGPGDEMMIFAFVTPGTTTAAVTGSPWRTTCGLEFPSIANYPIEAHTLTQLRARCVADTTGPGLTQLTGTVRNEDGVVPNATVEFVDHPTFRTTADANGTFSLEVPVGTYLVRSAGADQWAQVIALEIPEGGRTGIELRTVTSTQVEEVRTALGLGSLAGKGIVVLQFDNVSSAGGTGATLGAASMTSFTFNADGDPVASATTIAGGDGFLGFVGIAPGTTTVTLANGPADTCTFRYPSFTEWPVEDHVVTQVPVVCNPDN